MKLILLLLLPTLLFSASLHSRNYAEKIENGKKISTKKVDAGLKISGKIDKDYSSEYFGFIDLCFENKSDNWVDIKEVNVYFRKDAVNSNVRFSSGRDLAHWKKSMDEIIEREQHQKRVVLGTLTAFSYGVNQLSSNDNVKAVSGVSTIGLGSSIAVSEFRKKRKDIERSKIFPENHLLSDQFIIPPGLHSKKFVLLNSYNHDEIPLVQSLYMELVHSDGTVETYKLRFRELTSNSNPRWQQSIFARENAKYN